MKKKLLQIRIEEDVLKAVRELAEYNSITVSGQIRMLIKKEVRRIKKEENS